MRTLGRISILALAAVLALALYGWSPPASAQNLSSGPTIVSDQADYPPGGTVVLTGAGWQPAEVVRIVVNDTYGASWQRDVTVTADDGGLITDTFTLPTYFVSNYDVKATGPLSGVATTTFTDLSIGTYDQCSNDLGTGYTSGDMGCRWINGNLQSNNSRYFEGDATVQRVWLTGFVPGSTHTVTLKYGTTKGGKHAYDFLTTWDWSEDWVTLADRCQDITGCTTAGETALDIPQDPNVPNSFEPSAPGDRQFVMRGGTLNSATTPAIVSGTYNGDSETIITVSFTVASSGAMCAGGTCDVALWFGAHVSAQANWGLGMGAGSISGSPYHVALDAVDGASVGQRDNQMQANVVTFIPNGTIVIVKDAVPNDAQDFSFNLNNNSTIDQNFALDDDGDATLPNSQTFSVPPGTWTASELNIPSTWSLTSIVCVDPTNNTAVDLATGTATIDLASLETVTCTFKNERVFNKDLTVTKTAVAAFARAYKWKIDKSVDDTLIEIAAGGLATFNYTVKVTPDGYTDGGWTVSGKITVNNPNTFAVSGVNVADAIDNGGACTVTDGTNVSIAAGGSAVLDYTCAYAVAPSAASGTNTATATWDATTYNTPTGSAKGTASVDFAAVTPTETNRSITVKDDQTTGTPATLGTSDYVNGPFEFKYSLNKLGVAGTCTDYTNTAVIAETSQSDSEKVTVCVGKDLTVSKTATASLNRTYNWLIAKSVDKTRINVAEGDAATFNYTVRVTPNGYTDSGYTLGGTITVANPNDWEIVTLTDVSDSLDASGTCSITEAAPYVVPKSGSLTLHYTCANVGVATTNTATVTWDKAAAFTPNGSASGSTGVTFTVANETNKTITVVDDKTDPANPVTLGTWSWADGAHDFTYALTKAGVAGECTDYTNTAVIDETDQDASQTVKVCVGKDLTVTKTAAGTFDRLYKWTIAKSVDDTRIEIAQGGTATFNYTVDVTPNGVTDSGWALAGTITVANPNKWQAITATVTDVYAGGGTCTVTGGTDVLVPANGSVTLNYSCAFATQPAYTGTNTATATWDKALAFTPSGTATGTANATLALKGETNRTVTVVDDKTNPASPVTLGTSDYINGPFKYEYALTKAGVAGTCTNYTNTAVIDETDQEAKQTVTVCVGKDLTVAKTATPTFLRTFFWDIAKDVDKTLVRQNSGSATFNYTVLAEQTGFTDSAWRVVGTITVGNPNDWQSITADVADAVDNGGSCTVYNGLTPVTSVSVPASGTKSLTYTCTWASRPDAYSGTNTVTATWNEILYATPNGTASNTANFTFDNGGTDNPKKVNEEVTVTDTFNGTTTTLGTLTATTTTPYTKGTYTYARTVPVPVAGCQEYTNTAKIVETGQSDSETVTVCKASLVTDSRLCTLTNDQFKLVYTPDQTQSNGWKLNASNPGQYYYNVFYTGDGNEDITLTLPYPFVTQGATPIHVYSDLGVTTTNGTTCLTPSGELANEKDQVTLATYGDGATPSYNFSKTTTVTIHVPATPDGFAYINIHLDYGLKGTTGYAKGGPSGNDAVRSGATSTVLIPDNRAYAFSDTAGGAASVTSTNSFKKNPGIGGLALKSMADGSQGEPVKNTRVDIYDGSNKLVATVYTDEDGWYMWQYKWTGKAATFTVKMPAYNLAKSVTLKANGYVSASFDVP